jgi:hypothetical protein
MLAGWLFSLAFIAGFFYVRFRLGHARFLNLLRRVGEVWFLAIGSLGAIVELVWAVWPELFPNEQPTPVSTKLATAAVFAAAAAAGYLIRRWRVKRI